jgi:hypothetical protein
MIIINRTTMLRVIRYLPLDFAATERTVAALRRQFAGQRRRNRILTEFVMVVQVLMSQSDADHPLQRTRFDDGLPVPSAGR